MGVSCTYVGPSHKRGPPKGYILALERRLHQVEALLGTIISSDDPRARGLIQDLSRDQLAAHIIRRVKIGPFGPRGRLQQPFGSTKEDFLTAIMAGSGDDSPGRYGEENYALVSPDRDWQDRLHALLQPASRQNALQYPTQAPAPYALPSLRQLSSPAPLPQHPQQQQQQQQQQHHHQQQQQHALMQSMYPAKLETGSPVPTTAMLAPLNTPYGSHSPLSHSPQPAPYGAAGGARLSWDGFNGYQRLGDGGAGPGSDDGGEPKARYELAPGDGAGGLPGALGGAGAGGRSEHAYALPRAQENASDPQRWYYTNQQAVG